MPTQVDRNRIFVGFTESIETVEEPFAQDKADELALNFHFVLVDCNTVIIIVFIQLVKTLGNV